MSVIAISTFFAEDPAEDDDLLGEDDNEDFGEEFDLEEAEERDRGRR